MNAIFDAYSQIHARGVAHQDTASRNMRIYWGDPQEGPPRVVIFDFDRCNFGQNWQIRRDEIQEMEHFLTAIGAFDDRLPVYHWMENGGRQRYKNFGENLLPPRLRAAWKEGQRIYDESVIKL